MNSYQHLCEHFKKIDRFSHLGAICGWDQASMMPVGGNQARSQALAELAVLIHQQTTDPSLPEWLDKAKTETLSPAELANLHEMSRQYQQASQLPGSLVQAKSLAGSKCEHAWREQRVNNDWTGFSKNLTEVVKLSREEAGIRAEGNCLSPYDALLELYEPGLTSSELDTLFGELKSWLPELIQQVCEKQKSENLLSPAGPFPTATQNALGLDVMERLGFDFNHGRLDISVHPFCGGVPTDVRITTRYDENDFTQSLMGIIHETGHARYEQNLPAEFAGLPGGVARSMGIHESQSLFFEMQLGRNPAFLNLLSPLLKQHLGSQNNAAFETTNLSKLYNRVNPGYIRVDADEVTYPAHVILRYEIERALIDGQLEVADIPDAWDEKMQGYLNLSTKGNFKDGCMQDIHWTDGSFGYFPSYTLGAIYAAQFAVSINQQVGDINQLIGSQDFDPIFAWLKQNIWSKASLLDTHNLVKQATGEKLNPAYFKQHLQTRYLGE